MMSMTCATGVNRLGRWICWGVFGIAWRGLGCLEFARFGDGSALNGVVYLV